MGLLEEIQKDKEADHQAMHTGISVSLSQAAHGAAYLGYSLQRFLAQAESAFKAVQDSITKL